MNYLSQFFNNKLTIKLWISAYVVFCIAVALSTIYMIVVGKWYGPFRDMWEVFDFLESSLTSGLTFEQLIEPYAYSHRLFVPKLLFYIDYAWFKGTNTSMLLVSVGCQLLVLTLLFKSFLSKKSELPLQIITAVTLLAMTFYGSLYFNFLHTFDVQWFVVVASVVSCFYIMVHLKGSFTGLFLGLLFLLPGILSNFSALLAIPALILFIVSKHKNIKVIVAQLFVCVFILGLYFVDFYDQQAGFFIELGPSSFTEAYFNDGVLRSLSVVFYWIIVFPIAFLSNPLSQSFLGVWPVFFVVLLVVLFFVWVWLKVLLRQRRVANDLEWLALLLIVYSCGVGFSVGIGRGWDFNTVYADRFQNIVLLFWLAVLFFFFNKFSCKDTLNKNIFIFCAPLSFMILFGLSQYSFLNKGIRLGEDMRISHAAVVLGLSDDYQAIGATVSRFRFNTDVKEDLSLLNEANYLKEINAGPFLHSYTKALDDVEPFTVNTLPLCGESYWRVYDLPKGETKLTMYIPTLGKGQQGLVLHSVTGEWLGLILPRYGNDFIENITNRLIGAQTFEGFLLNDSRLHPSANQHQPLVLQDVATNQPVCMVTSPY